MTTMNPLTLGERRPPTKDHMAAIWEVMLGTVAAADREGNVRYFDYDYAAAIDYAELDGCDLRTARRTRRQPRDGTRPDPSGHPAGPRMGQLVLYRRVS